MLRERLLAAIALLGTFLTGCDKQYKADDGYIPEVVQIEAKETKVVHFFDTTPDFHISQSALDDMNRLLKNVRGEGADNIGFMLVANRPILLEEQKAARKQIVSLMQKNGFMNSRIVDSGVCVYKDAKTGVRIDVLKYETSPPDCSPWSEYIGDLDTNKHLPKHGAAEAYNLTEMIANSADLVSPRKYSGQETNAAIAASGTSAGGGGGASAPSK